MIEGKVWRDKLVLAVDDEENVLLTIQDELSNCPGVTVHTALTLEKARAALVSHTYDLVVLGIMGVRELDILKLAVGHKFPVVILTSDSLNPVALNKSIELGARAYLPRDQLGTLIPLLENVTRLSQQTAWKKALDKIAFLVARIMRRATLEP
jgi:DNA-binding NarL/FixJ family response regulator